MFAVLFGIADQVAEDFRKIYPDYFDKPYDGGGYYSSHPVSAYHMVLLANSLSRTSAQAVESARYGGGGGSSAGGGGGFSGGGGGGGSR